MEDAELHLNLEGEPFTMNRNNATLFTFTGELAMYNHVFLMHDEDEERAYGTYVFRENDTYRALANFIINNRFPRHMDMNDVPECDREAYAEAHPIENPLDMDELLKDLNSTDTVPEGWE